MRRITSVLLWLAGVCIVMISTFQFELDHRPEIRMNITNENPYQEFPLSVPFFFYGKSYKKIYISKDGFLTLGPVLPRWSPMKLPLPKGYSPLIAVYWADMVTWKESLILAEEFLSGWRMEQATTLIRRRFPDFTAKHVVLVNWVYMKMWIRNITKLSMERTVSFEALLTTDMSRSFVVFNYDGPAVTIGEASTYHAQVGFDAGNNKDSFTMRKALTKDINRLLMYDSNVDESGAQLFHTDEEKISYDQQICHSSYKECLDTSDGVEYKGREYQTASGRTCQAWSSQEPHPHEQCKFTERSNYCSNSIDTACRKAKPWCYTMDPKMTWELCDIPECGDKIKLTPTVGHTFGGTSIVISGVCIPSTNYRKIRCRFDERIVVTGALRGDNAICVSPMIGKIGQVKLELSFDEGNTYMYEAPYTLVNVAEESSMTRVSYNYEDFQWGKFDTQLSVTWTKDYFYFGDLVKLNIWYIYVRDVEDGAIMDAPKVGTLLLAKDVPNTGSWKLNKELGGDAVLPFNFVGAIQVEHPNPVGSPERVSIFSELHVAIWYFNIYIKSALKSGTTPLKFIEYLKQLQAEQSTKLSLDDTFLSHVPEALNILFDQPCGDWYDKDKASPLSWQNQPPCPCSSSAAQVDMKFRLDPVCRGSGSRKCSTYHPGAKTCFRTVYPGEAGHQQQCCYDTLSQLLPFNSGGGYTSKLDAIFHPAHHLLIDVWPYLLCTKFTANTAKYHQLRPTDNCIGYSLPLQAHIFGAGHIITFSGTLYKFYQLGDFWLLNHADFKMQGRTVSNKRSSNSNEPGVALWQSVAMKCGNSDVVRVTGIPYKTMAFFVNDIPRKYTGSTQVHKGVHISFCSDGYTIHFKKDSKDYIVNVNVVNKDESSTLVIKLQWPGKIDEVNGLLALTTAPDANTEAFTAELAESNYVENSRVSMLEQYVDENAYSIQRARNMAFRPLSSADMDTSVKSKASEICSGERYQICNVDYMLLKATSAKAAKVGYIARNTYQMANEYEVTYNCDKQHNPCNPTQIAWGVRSFNTSSSSQYVQCNMFADCHVMDCPKDSKYQPHLQMCARSPDVDDKLIAVIRYLEGERGRKLKERLQMELLGDGVKPVMLDLVRNAAKVTSILIDQIDDELSKEGGETT